MKKLLYILLSAILAAATACHHRSAASLGDFDISLYAPAYSSGFEIFGAEGMKSTILKTYAPWQGAEGEETQLFIARNGEQAPADFPGQVLDGDARHIVCMSSTYIAMLDALGEPHSKPTESRRPMESTSRILMVGMIEGSVMFQILEKRPAPSISADS